MSDKYNGWTNWETWNVACWMLNDKALNDRVMAMANNIPIPSALAWALMTDVRDPIYARCDMVFDEWLKVNWMEIAVHLINALEDAA